MKGILLLSYVLLSLGGNAQCILSLKNCTDSTITISIDRLDIRHTLSPKEIYTCPKVIPHLQKYETTEVLYDGLTTTFMAMPDSAKYTKGRYELSFFYRLKGHFWDMDLKELKSNYR